MTKLPLALAIALTFASVIPLSGCDRAANLTEQEHIQRAKDSEDKGDLRGSIIELKSALQKSPNSPQARLMLGQTYLKVAKGPEAEKELTQAEKLGVSRETIKPLLGEALLLMGEYKRVLDEIQPSEQTTTPNLARILQLRGHALLGQGQVKDACNLFQQSYETHTGNPPTYWGLAQCAVAESDIPKAKEWLETALKLDPKFSEALYLKAALLESENKPDDATKIYQQILANDPSQYRAHLAIAGLRLKKGDIEGADKAIQGAEKVDNKAPTVMLARGALEFQRGNLDSARNVFLEILRVRPDHLPTILGYAMTNYGLGNYEQSINSAGKVLSKAPHNLVAGKILAGSQLKTGDVKGALRTLESSLSKHPGDSQLHALTGDAYLRAGDYDKAMFYLDKAAELEPANAAIKVRQAAGRMATGKGNEALADLEQVVSLTDKAGKADLALVMLRLGRKEYDQALKAIAELEKKLPNNPVTHNLRATALLGKQDRTGARKSLEKALAIEPGFLPAATNLARLDMQENKPDAARKRFESVLAADKNNVQAMLALAQLASTEKGEKEYVDWLEKASKADPKAMQPRAALVRHFLNKNEAQKALSLAQETINSNPDSLQALNLLGSTQMATGNIKAAIVTFSRATSKSPRSPDAYLRLALAQTADNRLGEARASLQKSLQIKPDFTQAQIMLTRLELMDKKPEAALQIARLIQSRQPNSPVGFNLEADVLFSQKRLPQAAKAYEQALAKGAGAASMIKAHRSLAMSGDTKTADQRLSQWLKQHPNDLEVRTYAAGVYAQSKRNREAIGQYEEVLKAQPNNAIVLNNLASLYQHEQNGRALPTAEQAFKFMPDSPAVQDTLGWILVEEGQLARGLDLLRKAADKAPQAAMIRYHYGVALARAGRNTEAKKELEAAIAAGLKSTELEQAKVLLKRP